MKKLSSVKVPVIAFLPIAVLFVCSFSILFNNGYRWGWSSKAVTEKWPKQSGKSEDIKTASLSVEYVDKFEVPDADLFKVSLDDPVLKHIYSKTFNSSSPRPCTKSYCVLGHRPVPDLPLSPDAKRRHWEMVSSKFGYRILKQNDFAKASKRAWITMSMKTNVYLWGTLSMIESLRHLSVG